jgi:hypothetical protein
VTLWKALPLTSAAPCRAAAERRPRLSILTVTACEVTDHLRPRNIALTAPWEEWAICRLAAKPENTVYFGSVSSEHLRTPARRSTTATSRFVRLYLCAHDEKQNLLSCLIPFSYFFFREARKSAAVVGPFTNVSSCDAMY